MPSGKLAKPSGKCVALCRPLLKGFKALPRSSPAPARKYLGNSALTVKIMESVRTGLSGKDFGRAIGRGVGADACLTGFSVLKCQLVP